MIELGFYENVVKFPTKGAILVKKLVLAILVAALVVGWVMLGLMKHINPGLIFFVALIPLLVGYIILLNIDVEYEYSINESTVTLARIFAKSRRRTVFETEGKDILFIAPATEENIKRAEAMSIEKRYDIYTEKASDPLWLIVFEGKKGSKYLFVFSAEQNITRILKLLRPSVIVYR